MEARWEDPALAMASSSTVRCSVPRVARRRVLCSSSAMACVDTTQQTSIDVSCWTHFDELGALLWIRFEGDTFTQRVQSSASNHETRVASRAV